MPRSNSITINEIAKQCNVSIATVSRVLNGKENVKVETRNKIMHFVESIDKDHTLLQKLEANTGDLIVIITFEDYNPILAPFAKGVYECAKSKGYQAVHYNCYNRSNEMIKNFEYIITRMNVAGFICINTLKDVTIMERLSLKIPFVICYEQYCSENISSVGVDDYEASRTAINYLISIGRKKIALLNGDSTFSFTKRREKGYRDALEAAGMKIEEKYIRRVSDFNYNLGRNAAGNLLQSEDRPDAIFAISDTFAAAVIKEASALNISVPNELAIVGFDNTEVSTMTTPSITTVGQPHYQIGYQGCSILINKIMNPKSPCSQNWINYEFNVRESTQ